MSTCTQAYRVGSVVSHMPAAIGGHWRPSRYWTSGSVSEDLHQTGTDVCSAHALLRTGCGFATVDLRP